tara:strand:+ start:1295 stop:1630 length:336 start_codon:yes stop_codon:yes gene_type:complete
MGIIDPVNIQQVIQMGSHTEKLQHTIQQQSSVLSQQLEEEHLKQTELLNTEVQDPENTQLDEFSEHDGKNRKGRIHKVLKFRSKLSLEENEGEKYFRPIEKPGGNKVNTVA